MLQPLEQAVSMYEEAREDKRLEARHRRRARERMQELHAFCARVGIAIEIVKTQSRGGHGHDSEQGQH